MSAADDRKREEQAKLKAGADDGFQAIKTTVDMQDVKEIHSRDTTDEGEWDDKIKIMGNGTKEHPGHLRIIYENEFQTLEHFYIELGKRMAIVNKKIEIEGINKSKIGTLPPIPKQMHQEYVFTFTVELYGNRWRVHKTFEHFKTLYSYIHPLHIVYKGAFPKHAGYDAEKIIIPSGIHRRKPLYPSPNTSPASKAIPRLSPVVPLGDRFEASPFDAIHAHATALLEFTMKEAIDPNMRSGIFSKILEFWEISKMYCKVRYQKVKEMFLYKYARGRKNDNCLIRTFKDTFNRRQRRWLIIGYNNIWYYRKSTDEPSLMRDNIMLDNSTELKLITISHKKVIIELILSRRQITLAVKDLAEGLFMIRSLVRAFEYSFYTKMHRFDSFAPVRHNNDCKLYVDGKQYFSDLAELIEKATDEIMICGWMISPEMPLIRPCKEGLIGVKDKSSLMGLLSRAANRGVRVYVLVYKEFESEMYNDSQHVKEQLEMLNRHNIKVLRHPTSFMQSILWSHHEKMVIVDRKVVMMGGLDIAWGRWDTCEHDLFDYHGPGQTFPGVDYYNAFKKDFRKGRLFKDSLISSHLPRMPWHDVAVQLHGPVVFDYLTHFVTYWNNSRELNNQQEVLFTQMSLTTPTYYISNSIKEVLHGTVGNNKSVIQALLEKKRAETSRQIGPLADIKTTDFRFDQNNEPALALVDEVDDREIHQFGYGMNDEPDNAHKFAEDRALDDRILSRFAYGTNIFKELDNKYETYRFIAPEEDFHKSPRLPTYTRSTSWKKKDQTTSRADSTMRTQLAGDQHISPSGVRITLEDDNEPKNARTSAPLAREYHPQNPQTEGGMVNLYPENFISSVQNDTSSIVNMHDMHLTQIAQHFAPLKATDEQKFAVMNMFDITKYKRDEIKYREEDAKDLDQANPLEHIEEEEVSYDKVPDEGLILQTFLTVSQKRRDRKMVHQGDFAMQALRSASPWSIGLTKKEFSIQNCYIESIANAKRFIYIENQFFISSTSEQADSQSVIRNRIVKAIYQRIKQAIDFKESFRVIVFMPLLPAFEADLQNEQGKVMQVQIGLENMTIGVGPNSLLEKLKALTDTPEKYIMICGLRKWAYPPGDIKDPLTGRFKPDENKIPATELIYIHSKVLMIIDDSKLIMGSANLNDRSMWGSRDSELAIYIDGPPDLEVVFNNRCCKVNKKIHEFRVQIFEEHFGLDRQDLIMPSSNNFWLQAWNQTKINTQVYEHAFKVYPTNQYSNFGMLKERAREEKEFKLQLEVELLAQMYGQKAASIKRSPSEEQKKGIQQIKDVCERTPYINREAFARLKHLIRGHAVLYPHMFLMEEKLIEIKLESGLGLMMLPIRALY